MFGRKKDKTAETAAEDGASAAVSQDLIVHNMPGPAKFGGAAPAGPSLPSFRPRMSDQPSAPSFEESPARGGADAGTGKATHKTIGIVIMAGGLVFIGALVYLSYIFVIKPAVSGQAPVAADQPVPVENQEEEAAIPAVPEATTTDSGLDAVTLDAATSTGAADTAGSDDIATVTPEFLVWPDSDNDGLNDQEELILGTSATSTDTDGDGYQDLAEISSGYDPAGTGRLSDSAQLQLGSYKGSNFSYEILSPLAWPVQTLADSGTVIFTAPDGSLIQVSVEDNEAKAGILGWYSENFPGASVTYDRVRTAAAWEGIGSEDGQNFYLTDNKHEHVFVLSYIMPSENGRLVYPAVFKMMIDSLVAK